MSRRVLVTGAGGFVGGFAARALAAEGFQVTAIVRRVPDRIERADRLQWLAADLLQPAMLPKDCDAIVHCAAELPSRTPDPHQLYGLNKQMADGLFDHADRTGVRTVIFLSSMSVYGTVTAPVVSETTIPQDPDPYGRAKRDAEDVLAEAVTRGAIESGLSIRLPGTVGRGSHHNFLSDTVQKVLAGGVVRAHNPEAQFNNIVHVADLARFFGAWMRQPKRGYFVTNLAADEPMTIRDVVIRMFATAGQAPRCEFTNAPRKPFLISLDRARELGYAPSTVRDSLDAFVRDSIGAQGGRVDAKPGQ